MRLADFSADRGSASEVVDLIEEAISILARHPLIGRRAERGLRELVISGGRTGYVALYRYEPDEELVFILAIRHQREAGFRQ